MLPDDFIFRWSDAALEAAATAHDGSLARGPSVTETVRRNYEYRLYPRSAQLRALDRQLRLTNDLWNAALEQRIRSWRDYGTTIGFTAQSAQLTEARRELPWLRAMNALAQHEVPRRLDRAMQAFFRRVKAGKTPGFPRFKRFDPCGESIRWAQHGNGCRAETGRRLYLQHVGNVKVRWHRPLPADSRVTQVTVHRRAGRWYAVLCIEMPAPEPLLPTGHEVGVDMGIRAFATLSTGEQIDGAHALRRAEKALLRSQRNVTRKRCGSQRRRLARRQLAREHDRVRRVRRDHAHKAARRLVDGHDLIAVEALKVRNMLRSSRGTIEEPGRNVAAKAGLNGAISDAAWRQFLTLLDEKASTAGRQLVAVQPRGTSQTCPECGVRDTRSRHRKTFRCVACGHTADADHNAAVNILRLARELASRRPVRAANDTHPRPDLRAVATVSNEDRDRDSNEYVARDPAVVALVRANVPGSEGFLPNDEPGALVALDDSDTPIGAAVVVLHTIGSGDLALYLWQLAVDPGWQRRGVGTVLLGTLPQLVGARPEAIRDHGALAGTFGACAPEQAGFYQHAGFDVSHPGVPLALSGPPRAIRASAGAKQRCWMVRGW